MALVRVDGLAELNRAFRKADKALVGDLKDALEEAAQPVRRDAQSLAVSHIRRIGPDWSRMRIGTIRGVVYVAPVERGTRNPRLARKKLAPRMLTLAMEPALARNEGLIIRRVDEALDDVAKVWERA